MRLSKAQVARLRQLERKGVLTPQVVLDDARKPDSVLHPLIEWDTERAALAWQLAQAQAVIRSVRVLITVEETEVTAVRYVPDPAPPPGRYRNMDSMNQSQRLLAVEQEVNRAAGHMRRAVSVAAVAGLTGLDEILGEWLAWSNVVLTDAAADMEIDLETAAD